MTDAQPKRRARRLIAVVAALALAGAGYVTVTRLLATVGPSLCEARSGSVRFALDVDQTQNAALVSAIAEKRGLPARAVTIALATALQESKLRNITHGDRDSIGLFQQRPSQGWGTEEQILDPTYATNRFFDALVKIRGYETMDIAAAAQRVQRSAYPQAYAKHESLARVFASTLTGHSPAGLVCRLDPTGSPGQTALEVATSPADRGLPQVAEDLRTQMGVAAAGSDEGGTVTAAAQDARQAWAIASWAVARAGLYDVTAVQVGDRRWLRGKGDDAMTWSVVATTVPSGQVAISLAR